MITMSIQIAFYFDQSRCMSCNACTVACKDWNQLNPGLVNWREQFTYEQPPNGFFPLSLGCSHCETPACASACPSGAIKKDEEGVVSIHRELCLNYQACLSACPFAKPKIADDKQEPHPFIGWEINHPAQKCNACRDRLSKGDKPACVKACVGRALDFGEINEIIAKYPSAVRLNPIDFPYAYKNNRTETNPCVFIKKRGGLTVHRSSVYTGRPA